MPTITESAVELQRRMPREKDAKKRQRLPALYLAASGQAQPRQGIAALLGVHRPALPPGLMPTLQGAWITP